MGGAYGYSIYVDCNENEIEILLSRRLTGFHANCKGTLDDDYYLHVVYLLIVMDMAVSNKGRCIQYCCLILTSVVLLLL